MFSSGHSLHFVGIGGIGMSGLAELCLGLGCRVSGSDARLGVVTARLQALGIAVHEGHAAGNVPASACAVVVTSAVKSDNPEVAEARRRGLPVVLRGEMLAELMKGHRGVAVGGSHGKTTTSSMLAQAALAAGLNPTVFVGTLAPFLGGGNARLGGEIFITECDESDGSFLELAPEIALITNIDREHLDYWKTFENAVAGFVRFANRVAYHGAVVACLDDAEVRAALPLVRRRVIRYGRCADADLRILDDVSDAAGSRFRLRLREADWGEFHLRVLGGHNVLNAAAAAATLHELGVDLEAIRAGLAQYAGTGRRMELRGKARGVTVMDDYGHHPTEVKATLNALRLAAPGRLGVLFQPHRYTGTLAFMHECAGALGAADVVRVMEIYAASEPPIEGVTGQSLADRIRGRGHADCRFAGNLAEAVQMLAAELREGDLVLTLGAGSVTQAGELLLKALEGESAHG
ncbi:MAG: UDP-N-acetylmuramate--L-alanine ligase [Acidobacteria bacterium]|nr:UDP-N-acetylmuramate--L-alanine ligase [Acidobacteriota bacterium]